MGIQFPKLSVKNLSHNLNSFWSAEGNTWNRSKSFSVHKTQLI